MSISKLLYQDLPNAISAIRQLVSINKVQSRGLNFKLLTDNWITKFRARTFNEKEPEMLDWIDGNLRDDDILFDVGDSEIQITSCPILQKKLIHL